MLMWPLNYEDLNKFHISLGIGLMVAAFLLHIVSTNTFWSNIEKIEMGIDKNSSIYFTKVEGNKTYVESKTEVLFSSYKNDSNMALALLVSGSFLFLWGYFKFFRQQVKKK